MSERISFCRICEALCGIVVDVDDKTGRVISITGDREHPVSKGFICPKGARMVDVQNDPDRLLYPLKRVGGPGEFERIGWDQALDEIAGTLRGLVDAHGPTCVGNYVGNPSGFSYSHMFWLKGFFDAIGETPHHYNTNSQDGGARLAASALLYGNPVVYPIPDLPRTRFLLMFGANPIVTMGSAFATPRVRDHLNGIVRRGGRVVVVDPRRTPTAQMFEHRPIRAGTDVWFLLSLLHVLFAENLADRAWLSKHADNAAVLEELVRDHPPETTSDKTAIEPDTVRELARAFAGADGAVAYGRLGVCSVAFGTLTSALVDLMNIVTGNLDRPGGAVFGWSPVDFAAMSLKFGMATYGTYRSRIGDFPEIMHTVPTTVLAKEITTPGPGQLRALFVAAGNPVLSAPNGSAIAQAMEHLELSVALDFYVSETAKHCGYVLPATTFLEREDMPILGGEMITPFAQITPPVVAPAGEAREEWQVYDELARRMGLGAPSGYRIVRLLGRLGFRLTPRRVWDLLLRTGPAGDWFGLRGSGLSFKKLLAQPRGVVLRDELPTGRLRDRVNRKDGRVDAGPEALVAEVRRLRLHRDPAEYPLRMIGMRDLRSINSWMHNVARLTKNIPRRLLVNPEDAMAHGIENGATVRVTSKAGTIDVPADVTDEVTAGTVAYPHGWGHAAGWKTASASEGVNCNVLASDDPEDVEALAGMSRLNGIPVRLECIAAAVAGNHEDARRRRTK